jgi:small nuclear ribonucleoprotein (snRNP)-like protein
MGNLKKPFYLDRMKNEDIKNLSLDEMIGRVLRITIVDDRMFEGSLKFVDHFGTLVLEDVKELVPFESFINFAILNFFIMKTLNLRTLFIQAS